MCVGYMQILHGFIQGTSASRDFCVHGGLGPISYRYWRMTMLSGRRKMIPERRSKMQNGMVNEENNKYTTKSGDSLITQNINANSAHFLQV